jgi:hypothetical protein
MALTKTAINRINSNASAQKGKVYLSDTGEYYIGLSDGRLSKELPMVGDVIKTTLRSVVAKVGDYTTAELMALLTSLVKRLDTAEEDIDNNTALIKKTECKLIGMNIVLG